jgi:RimJ/RimL family protein N-acetyltransferase
MLQIAGERLVLRDLQPSDWPLIEALWREPLVTRYQDWFRFDDEAQGRRWLAEAIRYNEEQPRHGYNLAVTQRRGGEAIGWLGFGDPDDLEHGKAEVGFGYALLPHSWNHGYMTEAVQMMLVYVFETLGKKSVSATCETTNAASARVLEKAGLFLTERWLGESSAAGEPVEQLKYSLDATEWKTAR